MQALVLLLLGSALVESPAAAHGSLHERIHEMDRLVSEHPDQAEPYLRRAELYREHEDFEAAFADIARARDLEPALARTDLHLARAYLAQGRLDAARDAATRFLTRTQGRADDQDLVPRAHELLAEVALKESDGLLAADHLASAIAGSERPAPTLFLQRSAALELAGPDHSAEAIAALDDGIGRLGPLPTLLQRAMELEIERKDYGAALDRIEAMIAVGPNDPSLVAQKGRLLELDRQPERALHAYLDARRLLTLSRAARQESPASRTLRTEIDQAIARLSKAPPSAADIPR